MDDRTRPAAAWGQGPGPDDRTRPAAAWGPGPGPDDRTRPAAAWGQGPGPGPDDRTRADRRTTSASGEWGPRRFQPGVQVGEFVLEQKLGQGGMGAVFVARHVDREQRVALKVLLVAQDELRDEELERFRREGQAQAAVDAHPNVLRVITQGTHEGYPFLVTELASGGDLKARLKRGPMEPRAAAELASALARGLAHVHARGVLHRDLKPGNVVFGEDDAPKLMDFGLARLQGARRLTQTGATMGTPAYMAPEQAAGERVDERADVYGLGAILYECLTGRAPFEGASDIGIIKQVLTDEVEPPRALRPDVPLDLDAVVVRALAREPERRYQTADAFAEDLRRFLSGEPPLASPRRRRGLGAATVLCAACGLGGVVAWRVFADAAPVPAASVITPSAAFAESPTSTELREWLLVEEGASAVTLRARVQGDVRVRITPLEVGQQVDSPPRLGRASEREAPSGDDVAIEVPIQGRWQRVELVAAGAAPAARPLDARQVLVIPAALRRAPDAGPLAAVAKDGSVLLLVTPGEVEFVGRTDDDRRRPTRRQVLTPFFLGRSEVSWAQVEAHFRGRKRTPLTGGTGAFHPPGDHPAVWVTPHEAEAYCRAYGLRLPTDLEWEYAAQGVTNGNVAGSEDGFEFTAPVQTVVGGPAAVGRWGHLHLRGNVWEFVQRPPGGERAPNYGAAWDRELERFRAEDSLSFASDNTGFRVALGLDGSDRVLSPYPER